MIGVKALTIGWESLNNITMNFDSTTGTLTFTGNGTGDGNIPSLWKNKISEYNTKVTSLIINDGIKTIGQDAFSDCANLKNVTISSGITTIKDGAFAECESLENIEIPNSVTEIGEHAFIGCGLKQIVIPKGITSIKTSTFTRCAKATDIQIPDSVTNIESSAFANCDSITTIKIPESVISIGEGAFTLCDKLEQITIPKSVNEISSFCFKDCTNLESVVLEDGLEVIGPFVFSGCTKLQNISIPNSVTKIGRCAFEGCEGLQRVTIPGNIIETGEIDDNGMVYDIFKNCTGLTDVVMLDGLIRIPGGSFRGCTNLKNVTIPNSVNCIGQYAFSGCQSLTNIVISENVETIEKGAFARCDNLIKIEIPEGVKSIGEAAFYYCENLTEIIISDTVTNIDDDVFSGCSNLIKIVVPNSVTDIADKAFYNSSYLGQENRVIYCRSDSAVKLYAEGKKINYVIDDDVPNISNVTQEGAYIKIEATDDSVGLNNKAYSLDEENWYENNSIAVDESKTYTVYVKDKLGNIATKDIQIDITQPEITNISVEGYTIKVTATDNVALADNPYSIDETNYQSSNEFTVTKEGTYKIYVKDAQGNVATKSVVVNKKTEENKDTTAPNITNISVEGYTIKVTATDNIALADNPYSIDGTNYQLSNEFTVTKEGTYTIYVKDAQGNVATKSVVVNKKTEENKDTTAPNITNVSVEGYTIKVTATDNVALADKAYSLDKENWQSSNEIVVTKTGRYMVYVRDKSGNIVNKLVVVGGEENGSNNSNKSESVTQQDNSQSKKNLPQTGSMSAVIVCTIVIIFIACIIIFKKIKKMKF